MLRNWVEERCADAAQSIRIWVCGAGGVRLGSYWLLGWINGQRHLVCNFLAVGVEFGHHIGGCQCAQ